MKQRLVVMGVIFVILWVLAKSGVLDSLLFFLLVGAIPGTNWSIPSSFMMILCAVAVLLVVFRYTAISLIEQLDLHRRTKKYIARKERMPKRRFRSITH